MRKIKPDFYYIEKDGRVFLVTHGRKLTFPRSKSEFSFEIQEEALMELPEGKVRKCEPKLKEFPKEWLNKDKILSLNNVEEVVKKAIVVSYPRLICASLIVRDKKVLMVKPSRGLNKGDWIIPGGFVDYGESPEKGVIRETSEETGLDIKTVLLFKVYSRTFADTNYHMVLLVYFCEASGEIRIDKTEISEAKFIELKKAIKLTKNPLVRLAIEDLVEKRNVKELKFS